MSKPFPWGRVIDRFEYDFDGAKLSVTKYYPKKHNTSLSSREYEDVPFYHVEEMRAAFPCMDSLLIGWLIHRNVGFGNQDPLLKGMCRALNVKLP